MKIYELFLNMFRAIIGLFILASGIYLTIQANIGLAPWDCFCMGVAEKSGLSYGQVSFSVGIVTIIADILLKQEIGPGTLLNVAICGPVVDCLSYFNPIPLQNSVPGGLLLMFSGMFLQGFGRYIYMSAALSCGPRDALVVGIGRKFNKAPIGKVNTAILAIVLAAGILMGGKAGIGTVISALGLGTVMQFIFNRFHFDPRSVNNLDLKDTFKVLSGKEKRSR